MRFTTCDHGDMGEIDVFSYSNTYHRIITEPNTKEAMRNNIIGIYIYLSLFSLKNTEQVCSRKKYVVIAKILCFVLIKWHQIYFRI